MDLTSALRSVCDELHETLLNLAEERGSEAMTPEAFIDLLPRLRAGVNRAGRDSVKLFALAAEEESAVIEHEGQKYRFKQITKRTWLSSFGPVELERRYFQPDAGGKGYFPVDARCGMDGRYLTPELEEVVALGCAMLPPREIHTLLEKAYPQAPSVTSLQSVIEECGEFAEEHREEIEEQIENEKPLEPTGELLVISWDGVTVPLIDSEGAARDGRGSRQALWREASVASISSYRRGKNGDDPERIDAIYQARMPESGMRSLLSDLDRRVTEMRRQHPKKELVVICDGKPSIWKTASMSECYAGATQILDFYHAAEHLSNASHAIFGERSGKGTAWYRKYRSILQEVDNGAEAVIRSMRYYKKKLRTGSEAYHIVRRAIAHFTKNKERMRYSEYLARGLPIGSGPVEAACKTIVDARLKRSGMRWTRAGGQHVLNLRVHHLSHRWDCFWSAYTGDRCAA